MVLDIEPLAFPSAEMLFPLLVQRSGVGSAVMMRHRETQMELISRS